MHGEELLVLGAATSQEIFVVRHINTLARLSLNPVGNLADRQRAAFQRRTKLPFRRNLSVGQTAPVTWNTSTRNR
jgi:hypothetical protein